MLDWLRENLSAGKHLFVTKHKTNGRSSAIGEAVLLAREYYRSKPSPFKVMRTSHADADWSICSTKNGKG